MKIIIIIQSPLDTNLKPHIKKKNSVNLLKDILGNTRLRELQVNII